MDESVQDVWPPSHAGWFRDPWGEADFRYFDARDWTSKVMGRPLPPKAGMFSSSVNWEKDVASLHRLKSGVPVPEAKAVRSIPRSRYGALFLLLVVSFCFFLAISENESSAESNSMIAALILGSVLASAAFVWAAWAFVLEWKKWALVKDLPTVDAAGAHLGVCEIEGVVEQYYPLTKSFITDRLCVWSFTSARESMSVKSNRYWATKWWTSEGSFLFYLKDSKGDRILVDMSKVDSRDLASFYCEEIYWTPKVVSSFSLPRQYTETGLEPGQKMFVVGQVQMTEQGSLVVANHAYPGNQLRSDDSFVVHRGTESSLVDSLNTGLFALFFQLLLSVVFFTTAASFTVFTTNVAAAVLTATFLSAFLMVAGSLGGWVWRTWNRLKEVKWRIGAAWSLIDVAAQRRHDLIGALNGVVVGLAAHEIETQQKATGVRLPTVEEVEKVNVLDSEDEKELVVLKALNESNPELVAGEAFQYLMLQVTYSENQIAASRKFYNDAVAVAQTLQEQFPSSLLAKAALGTIPPLHLVSTQK